MYTTHNPLYQCNRLKLERRRFFSFAISINMAKYSSQQRFSKTIQFFVHRPKIVKKLIKKFFISSVAITVSPYGAKQISFRLAERKLTYASTIDVERKLLLVFALFQIFSVLSQLVYCYLFRIVFELRTSRNI